MNEYITDFKPEKPYLYDVNDNIVDDKRNFTILKRTVYKYFSRSRNKIKRTKAYLIHCNICGGEYIVPEASIIKGIGCGVCKGSIVQKGINDIATTAPWMMRLLANIEDGYTHTFKSHDKILFKCPHCGRINKKKKPVYQIAESKHVPCICHDGISSNEKFFYNMLEQTGVKFAYQFSPEWCFFLFNNKKRKGIYDFSFYINDKKYILEIDGEQHTNKNSMFSMTLEERIEIDRKKDKLANENGYSVIRINCHKSYKHDQLKNDAIEKLGNILDLTNINWSKCFENATTSLLVKACKLKKDNPNLTTGQIAKIMNMTSNGILNYLKVGAKIGLCDYDPKEESVKSQYTSIGNYNVYKDGELLCENKDIKYLENNSVSIFGFNVSKSTIYCEILGKRKTKLHDFVFKNTTNLQLEV